MFLVNGQLPSNQASKGRVGQTGLDVGEWLLTLRKIGDT